jgi:DNA polymerase-1
MARWILVDGFNLAFRCFHAVPGLKRSDGFPTNALYGWVRGLWKLQDDHKPDGCAVFYDLGGSREREALHPEYKANRSEMPEELRLQIPHLKEAARFMGFASIEREGVESDDLLASHAVRLARAGHEVSIASGDKDFAQVVGPSIHMLVPPPGASPKSGWIRLDPSGVEAKFGVRPEQIADYLALVGDTADNIPGLPGVGPKTASKWLQRHGNLEGVIAAAGTLEPERMRAVVEAGAQQVRRNLALTRLNLELASEDLPPAHPDPDRLVSLLESMEMRTHAADARKRYEPLLF